MRTHARLQQQQQHWQLLQTNKTKTDPAAPDELLLAAPAEAVDVDEPLVRFAALAAETYEENEGEG